jgi:hypothetical protein
MADLRSSIIADIEAKRFFAWQTRLRQVEEIYIRALYVLFIATEEEIPHILSGDMPNGVTELYRKVNDLVFENRGAWETSQQGQACGQFRPIDLLHNSAHASFMAISTAIAFAQTPNHTYNYEGFLKYLTTYCDRLEYMNRMFKAGRTKEIVLGAMQSMHRPFPPASRGG